MPWMIKLSFKTNRFKTALLLLRTRELLKRTEPLLFHQADLALEDIHTMDLDLPDLRLEAQAPQAAHPDQLDQAETPAQYQVILAHFSEIHIIFD